MSDEPAVSPTEAAMRAAWQEVCMMEYRITGDMAKATACADRIEKIYRGSVQAGTRATVLREAAEALRVEHRRIFWATKPDTCAEAEFLDRMADSGS